MRIRKILPALLITTSALLLSCMQSVDTTETVTDSPKDFVTVVDSPLVKPTDSLMLTLQHYSENGDPKTIPYADQLLNEPTLSGYTSDIQTMKVVYLGKQKKYKEAIALCDLIIKSDYTYLQAYLEKGWILLEQNQPKKALEVFELATTVKNNFAEGYFWKGRCYQKLKQKDSAILEFKKALALDPALEEARAELKSMGAIQ